MSLYRIEHTMVNLVKSWSQIILTQIEGIWCDLNQRLFYWRITMTHRFIIGSLHKFCFTWHLGVLELQIADINFKCECGLYRMERRTVSDLIVVMLNIFWGNTTHTFKELPEASFTFISHPQDGKGSFLRREIICFFCNYNIHGCWRRKEQWHQQPWYWRVVIDHGV